MTYPEFISVQPRISRKKPTRSGGWLFVPVLAEHDPSKTCTDGSTLAHRVEVSVTICATLAPHAVQVSVADSLSVGLIMFDFYTSRLQPGPQHPKADHHKTDQNPCAKGPAPTDHISFC